MSVWFLVMKVGYTSYSKVEGFRSRPTRIHVKTLQQNFTKNYRAAQLALNV